MEFLLHIQFLLLEGKGGVLLIFLEKEGIEIKNRPTLEKGKREKSTPTLKVAGVTVEKVAHAERR